MKHLRTRYFKSMPAILERFGRIYGLVVVTLSTMILLLAVCDSIIGIFSDPDARWMQHLNEIQYYHEQPWTQSFIADSAHITPRTVKYAPYVVWRRPEYKSATININSSGIRKTPGIDCSKGSLKVFVFGGSSIWGTGSPDWDTIPAYLYRELSRVRGGSICVVNFGESGWVSTQSMIALILELRNGNVPDVVMFYGGPNDMNAALENGHPFAHQDLAKVRARFDDELGLQTLPRMVTPNIHRIVGQVVGHAPDGASKTSDLETLAKHADEIYRNNERLIQALARSYGFQCHFFLEPSPVFGLKPLTQDERRSISRINQTTQSFLKHFYKFASNGNQIENDFTSLVDVFDSETSQIYIDATHMTPKGNERVARRMVEVLNQHNKLPLSLSQRSPGAPAGGR